MFKTLFLGFILGLALILGVAISALTADASTTKTTWSKATYAKLDKMTAIGFDKKLATYIINGCKRTAVDPARCITTASMIAKAESNAGRDAYKNNVFGINEGKSYATKEANFDRWLKSYNKYWHKSPLPEHYYPARGQVSKTRYCTDEHSSKSTIGCPNGQRIAKEVYKSFK